LKKHAIVGALFLLSMITYMDRVAISGATGPIEAELHLSDSAMGIIFSAFALGYAVAQIPCGWLADRLGPRIALTFVVALWSAMTALTGAAWNFNSLMTIRFLFGVSEAGAYPGAARAICNWLPPGSRGRANGILFSGSRVGGAVAFPLLAWMLTHWKWRTSFSILGVLGLFWAGCWVWWFRDHPEDAAPSLGPAVEPATQLTDVGAKSVLGSWPLILAMLQYFASNFTFFIGLSWMLPYLKRQFHLADSEAAAYAMTPLLAGALSQWFAGWMVDAIYRSRYRAWSRRIPAVIGFALSFAGLIALTRANSPGAAAACFTFAVFGSDMTVGPSWVFCADIAGTKVGSVSGAMNMVGNVGSFVSANAFPVLLAATGTSAAYFLVAAALNVLALFCWLGMGSLKGPVSASAIGQNVALGESG
jgi:ACS family glucarate transporter-like MFS transporter